MSILIKGMKMPSECEYCGFCRYYPENRNVWCNAVNRILRLNWHEPNWTYLDVPRPDWCPLTEVPTPHGRLIDADELIREIGSLHVGGIEAVSDLTKDRGNTWDGGLHSAWREIDDAPTVIEAEE